MSVLADAMSHAALGWVKPELDETLRQVRVEVECFVGNPDDTGRMRLCVGYLHQVQGTLRMVELYAPAMVADELERLAQALQDGMVADRDEACTMLMRGSVLLPDYLERLQNGHRDIPIVLLPLLNEIRSVRGVSNISENELFALDPSNSDASASELEHARGSLSGRNRELLDTVGSAVKEELLRVKDALDLNLRTEGPVEQLQEQVTELSHVADTLSMLGLAAARDVVIEQRDALKCIVESGQQLDETMLLDIAGALLHVDASLDDQVASLGTYHAGESEQAGSAAEARRTLDVLVQEAVVNFAAAREHLVSFIETSWEHSNLQEVPRLLNEVVGALRILELRTPAEYLEAVSLYINRELITKQQVPSGRQLDILANAMSSLEYFLEALRERRSGRDEILEIARNSLETLGYWPLPEDGKAYGDASLSLPHSDFELPISTTIAAPLRATEMAVASVAVEQPFAELVADTLHRDPSLDAELTDSEVVDAAEISAIELESVGYSRSSSGIELDAGKDGLAFDEAPIAPDQADVSVIDCDPVSMQESQPLLSDTDDLVLEEDNSQALDQHVHAQSVYANNYADEAVGLDVKPVAIEADSMVLEDEPSAIADELVAKVEGVETASSAKSGPTIEVRSLGGFEATEDEIDNEIREVFLEEFEEQLDNLSNMLPVWRAAPENMEALRPIRRVFHTLKGSGRLVGARVLGEFCWKIESMLNRVLDGSRPASAAVMAMVEQAYAVLPEIKAALRQHGGIQTDLEKMQAIADRIGAGEDASFVVADVQVSKAAQGTPVELDSVLLEILEAEISVHLRTVRAWVLVTQDTPQPASEVLLRALHTMKGAFAMTEVPGITDVTGLAEAYIKRSLANGITPENDGVEAILATTQAIAVTLEALKTERPLIPSFDTLCEKLNALVQKLPDAQWPPEEWHEEPCDTLETSEKDLSSSSDVVVPAGEPAKVDAEVQQPEVVASEQNISDVDAAHESLDMALPIATHEFIEDDMPLPGEASSHAIDQALTGHDYEMLVDVTGDQVDAEHAEVESLADVHHALVESVEIARDVYPQLIATNADGSTADVSEAVHSGDLADNDLAVVYMSDETVASSTEITGVEDGVSLEPQAKAESEELLDAVVIAPDVSDAMSAHKEDSESTVEEISRHDIAVPLQLAPSPMEITATRPSTSDLGMLDFDALDRELVDIFVEEGNDLLDHCDELIEGLRAEQHDHEILLGLQRDLHTLKGGARMAGIKAVGDVAHAIESLLDTFVIERGDIQSSDVQLLDYGLRHLHQLLLRTGEYRVVLASDELLAGYEARIHGYRKFQAETHFEQIATPAATTMQALSPALPAEESEADVTQNAALRPSQEQVRVRADLLDKLVNYAGEESIYRAQMGQQLLAFRSTMAELDRTNTRLRDQLRRLDLETEAQIVARYQRKQDQDDLTFDPLELDRFSTLQQLSRALNESADDLAGLQDALDDLARRYDGLLHQQSKVSAELQDGLMHARMVPLDSVVLRLRRVVRQAAEETQKQVSLALEGAHGEVDRNVLERVVAPLEHMLRNAVAHGLESPQRRRELGKAEDGQITIRLRYVGSEIELQVADDGAGMNYEAIRRRGEQAGLITPDASLSDADLDALIFTPGFSTSESISQLSGRGVGMEVVHNEVRQLGGSIDVRSVSGQGTTFTLRLPQTLAVTQAVFVRIGETEYAVPAATVRGIGRISRERYLINNGDYYYAGEEYAIYDLGKLLGQTAVNTETAQNVPLLLVRAGDLRVAVAIDQVIGNREIVIKPVGLQIVSVPGINGATITGDGSVVVILDVVPLVRRYLSQPAWMKQDAADEPQQRAPLVMVVEDSLTMRKVTGRILERNNLEVVIARDGIEALERLEERVPDLMLLDIEMPRMDGYELATHMRADSRYKNVPIVMITSRSGEKHRQRALEIGVQGYLGKPYQEAELMRNVFELLGVVRAHE